MIFNIAAFADTEPSAMTNKDYYISQSDLIDRFCDGSITYEQYQEQSQSLTNAYVNSNTVGGVIQGGALNASNNDLINAKFDIYNTAVNNYCSGYKKQTTVNQLYEKYRKIFPQFTKEYLTNAVEKSILKYLQTE